MAKKNHPGFWNKENIAEEALKYNTKWKFCQNSPGAYYAAKRLEIFEKVCSHMVLGRFYWTKELIRKVALKCKRRGEFAQKHRAAYRAAKQLGIRQTILYSKMFRFFRI